jgi:hypothetical protein
MYGYTAGNAAFRAMPALSTKEPSVKRVTAFCLVILCLAISSSVIYAAPPVQQEQNKCLIAVPASGSQVRGQVVIQGSATHPNFTWYQLGYAPEPNPTGEWKFFYNSETAVDNGQLAVWNTIGLPDGVYQLLLEVHRNDGNLDLCFATRLYVNNSVPTPTFTAEPLPTAADTPTPLPTPENTPTVLVEQPPTATPRATPTYSAIDNPTPTAEQTRIKLPINPNSIRDASCRGAQITVLIVVAVALYFVIRTITVSSVRKVWKSRDVEGFHTRRPRQY